MIIKKGTTDVKTYFKLIDPTTGAPETGLTITDLDATYVRDGAASVKADLTALAAVDSAHGDNKAKEVDGTNCPGLYRVDWPDAAFATGVDRVQLCVNGAAVDPAYLEVELVNYDPADGVRMGLTALPNAAAAAAGGLVICGTNAPIAFTGSGNAFSVISTSNGAGFYVEGNGTGHGIHAKGGSGIAVNGIYGETAGSGTGWAGTLQTGMITSTTFATGAITAAAIANGAIDNATFAADVGSTAYATNILAQAVDKANQNYDAPTKTEMDSAFTQIKGATWSTTDTLEAIRDRGDAAWITATSVTVTGGTVTTLTNAPSDSAGVTALLAMTEEVA